MSVRRLPWTGIGYVALLVVCCVALFGGLAWYIKLDQAATNKRDADVTAAMLKTNTVCGTAPADVETHSSWWGGVQWIEVKCPDGTVRVVRP